MCGRVLNPAGDSSDDYKFYCPEHRPSESESEPVESQPLQVSLTMLTIMSRESCRVALHGQNCFLPDCMSQTK